MVASPSLNGAYSSFIRRDPYLIGRSFSDTWPLSLPQVLPASEEDLTLIVNEVNEDVLKEQCPHDFSTVQEKDVRQQKCLRTYSINTN